MEAPRRAEQRLDPERISVLGAHRSRQDRHFNQAGITSRGWVFAREDGKPLSPSYLTAAARRAGRAARPARRAARGRAGPALDHGARLSSFCPAAGQPGSRRPPCGGS